jgi:hypothetical protein
MEFDMVVRHWFGDFGWAVLLALPVAALAWSQTLSGPTATSTKTSAAAAIHDSGRVSLLG